MKLEVQTTVRAPIDEVWRAYTTPEDIQQWNAASPDWHTTSAAVDLRKGGAFSFRMAAKDGSQAFDFAGVYIDVVPPTLLEYAFGDRGARVTFAEEPDGVRVRVAFDPETRHQIEHQQAGWQAILDHFKHYVEARATGV